MNTSQNPPGVSCLVHSGHVAKRHESSLLYDIHEGRLFRHAPHFAVGYAVVPAYIKDPPQAPLIQCINLSSDWLEIKNRGGKWLTRVYLENVHYSPFNCFSVCSGCLLILCFRDVQDTWYRSWDCRHLISVPVLCLCSVFSPTCRISEAGSCLLYVLFRNHKQPI